MSTRSKRNTGSNSKSSSSNNNDNDQPPSTSSASANFGSSAAATNDDSHSNGSSSTSSKPNIDLIEKLEAITGLTRSESMQLLEACNNDIDMAISIQLGTDISIPFNTSKPSTSTSSNKLSQIAHPPSNGNDDDDVRAPIPQKMEKLVDYEPFSVNRAVKRSRTVFDGFRDIQQEFEDQTDQTYRGSKKRTLAQLFRPPIDILFNSSFDVAKRFGRKTNKWILLNIQNQEEFDCQCLNRDLWSDETVKEIIKANFIFIQIYYDSTEGQKIIHFYNVNTYPFVAIIDPRTGEKMKQLPLKLDSPTFCEIITNFLSDHELPVSTDYDDDDDAEDGDNSKTCPTNNNNKNNNNTTSAISNGESSSKKASLLSNRFSSTTISSSSSTHHTNNIHHTTSQTTKLSSSKAIEQLKENSNSIINITSDSSSNENSNDSDIQEINDNNSKQNKDKLANKINGTKTTTTTTANNNNTNGNSNNIKKEKHVKFNESDKCEPATAAVAANGKQQQKDKVVEDKKTELTTQPKQIKYETDSEKKDCCLRIMMPNGDRLDFHTGGDDKLKSLVDYLKTQGYKYPKYELIERLLPQQQQQQHQQATTSSNCNNTDTNTNVNQARNLFRSDLNNSFKQHNLYPRVFLLLQEC